MSRPIRSLALLLALVLVAAGCGASDDASPGGGGGGEKKTGEGPEGVRSGHGALDAPRSRTICVSCACH